MQITLTDKASAQTTDYRLSHLGKGVDYDTCMSQGDFDTYMTGQHHRILSSIIRTRYGGRVGRYLDFACGTGRITAFVEPFADKSYGLDVSSSMVERARSKCPRTEFLIGDATRERINIAPVDLVTTFRFFGNAQDDLRGAALAALRPMLSPNGYLVFNNHRNPWSLSNLLLRCRAEREDIDLHYVKMRALLKDAGFAVVRSYGVGWWLVLNRLNRPSVFASPIVSRIEPFGSVPGVAVLSQDAVIVARRR